MRHWKKQNFRESKFGKLEPPGMPAPPPAQRPGELQALRRIQRLGGAMATCASCPGWPDFGEIDANKGAVGSQEVPLLDAAAAKTAESAAEAPTCLQVFPMLKF